MTNNLPTEQWKDIPGFPGYMASDWGRIKSFKRYRDGKIIKQCPHKNGYLYVLLQRDNKAVNRSVHGLIARTFCGNPDPEKLTYVGHQNDIKTDNRADNLYFTTAKENANHSIGPKIRQSINRKKFNAEHPDRYTKRLAQYDLNNNLLAVYKNSKIAAKATGIYNHKSIHNCARGARKTCGGFKWGYLSRGVQKIFQKDLQDNVIKIFDTMAAAARALGVQVNGISRCCRGELKTAYGYKFAYAPSL